MPAEILNSESPYQTPGALSTTHEMLPRKYCRDSRFGSTTGRLQALFLQVLARFGTREECFSPVEVLLRVKVVESQRVHVVLFTESRRASSKPVPRGTSANNGTSAKTSYASHHTTAGEARRQHPLYG